MRVRSESFIRVMYVCMHACICACMYVAAFLISEGMALLISNVARNRKMVPKVGLDYGGGGGGGGLRGGGGGGVVRPALRKRYCCASFWPNHSWLMVFLKGAEKLPTKAYHIAGRP